MADVDNVKTPLDALQDTLSRLKEMEHYSQTNIEKLAALWLEVSEHKEQKQYEAMVDEVLKCQNKFQDFDHDTDRGLRDGNHPAEGRYGVGDPPLGERRR